MSFEAKIKFYHFSDAVWLFCLSTNQYGINECCRRSLKKHFYANILKSEIHFHRNVCHFAPFLMLPYHHVFQPINMAWTTYIEGYLETFLPNILGGRRYLKIGQFLPFLMPQQPKLSTEYKSVNNFERRPSSEYSCKVWLKLVLEAMFKAKI